MIGQQTTPSPGTTSREDAVAQATEQASAEKAHRKATRPWFTRRRIALPSAVTLLLVIIMVSAGGNDPRIFDFTSSAVESRADSATKVTPVTATIGESIRDGRFVFTVTSVHRPSKTLTDRLGATETAEGAYVIVRVNVANIGGEARTLTATEQFLLDDNGQRFGTSSANSSLAGAETIFLGKINPGHTVKDAPLLFDVPAGTTIASIELHGSLSSTGVKVRLS